ncbi:hypothetical protein M5K25_025907 [Dendrobium thyrsiflorum]|uniref:Uncharacterized protein n=1 Tax=Dendrobium thyrsiflorum TaxID=117978 RepID=A0ABD0TW42_DENTH
MAGMVANQLNDLGFLDVSMKSHSFLDALYCVSPAMTFSDPKSTIFHGLTSHWISEEILALTAPQFALVCFIPKLAATHVLPYILHGLGSLFGRPLKIDHATACGLRPSVTCVLVELDITKCYPNRVWLGPKMFGYIQQVKMEVFLPFVFIVHPLGTTAAAIVEISNNTINATITHVLSSADLVITGDVSNANVVALDELNNIATLNSTLLVPSSKFLIGGNNAMVDNSLALPSSSNLNITPDKLTYLDSLVVRDEQVIVNELANGLDSMPLGMFTLALI